VVAVALVVGVAVVGGTSVDGELVEGVNGEFDPELLKPLELLEPGGGTFP
jgi:hypothetical protein